MEKVGQDVPQTDSLDATPRLGVHRVVVPHLEMTRGGRENSLDSGGV